MSPARQQEPDTIALLDPQPCQNGGEPFDVVEQLTVGHVGAEERGRVLVGDTAAASWEQPEEPTSRGSGSRVRARRRAKRLNHGRCGVMGRIIPMVPATLFNSGPFCPRLR